MLYCLLCAKNIGVDIIKGSQMNFKNWLEAVMQFPDEFVVHVNKKYIDQPSFEIPEWGYIRLFYTSLDLERHCWQIHMIKGEQDGAGTVLYFAALWWALIEGDKLLTAHRQKPAYGVLCSDSSLSPDAVRARMRMESQYGDYLDIENNPDISGIKVHRGDGSDWRRKATHDETNMWRLKKRPPFEFKFV
jgi:hypothetical protein